MLTYRITQDPKIKTAYLVSFNGAINQDAGGILNQIQLELNASDTITFDLEHIDYLDSLGIRFWIHFLRSISEGRTITYRKCAPMFISQIGLVPNLKGNATIEDFYVTFLCPTCEHNEQKLYPGTVSYSDMLEVDDAVTCSACGHQSELEFEPESYFSFLADSV